jgi:hypothetical protein
VPSGGRNERYDGGLHDGLHEKAGHGDREGDLRVVAGDSGNVVSRSLLLAWDVPSDQEEPWRRYLQELSSSPYEEYAQSRRRVGVTAESVWLAPKPSGGGVAVVYLEAEHPEQALRELAASDALFDSCYGTQMRRFLGMDLAGFPRVASGELLLAWRDDVPGEHKVPKDSGERESR